MHTLGTVDSGVTEADGDWVGEALDGVLPDQMDGRVWLQEQPQEVEPGRLANKFREIGTNLIVLASVSPIKTRGSDEKRVSYHVICYKADGDKVKKPNEADVARVRQTFFGRDLTKEERLHEGTMGDSRAYHFVTVFKWTPQIEVG